MFEDIYGFAGVPFDVDFGDVALQALNMVLDRVVSLSGAKYGYFGKLMRNDKGEKILKVLSYTNIAWTRELQDLVAKVKELEFGLEAGGLFAEPCRTGRTIIANDAPAHPASKGLPHGHPPLHNFISVPILLGGYVRNESLERSECTTSGECRSRVTHSDTFIFLICM